MWTYRFCFQKAKVKTIFFLNTGSDNVQSNRNVMCNLKEPKCYNWCILKKQSHHFADKGLNRQSYGFSSSHVWLWDLDHREGWELKNCCFWTVVLEKSSESLLWTARRSNQSILKEINPEYSLQGLVLKLRLQYPGHLMLRPNSLEKTLMLGKTEGRRRRGRHRMRCWMASLNLQTSAWVDSGR